jgi:LysM repeat protein
VITRTLRGAGALIALAAVMVGWPAALLAMAGAVSEWLPDLSDPAGLLARPDAGGLFLLIVLALGWIAWAVWTVALLVEVAAQARGVPTPRLGGVFPQRAAAALVTAIAVAFTASPAIALADTASAPASSAAAASSTTDTVTAAAGPEADTPTSNHDYTVAPGDTLWDIADEQLDDPQLWPEIAAASSSIEQPDGRHLDDPDLIRPGWTLNIPGDTDADDPTEEPASAAGEDLDLPHTPLTDPAQADSSSPGPTAPDSEASAPSPSTEQRASSGDAAIILPTTPLQAAGPALTALPPTPMTAGAHSFQEPAAAGAAAPAAWETTDEGRSTPRHGVLGLPDWIADPLTPTRPEDAPELVAALSATP